MFQRTSTSNNKDSTLYEGLIQRRTSVARNEGLNRNNCNSTNVATATPTFPTAASSEMANEASYQSVVNDAVAVAVAHEKDTSTNRKVYRSICDPDEIPDVARDVTWYDPFYENDSNIIAAFDIDQNKVKEYMEKSKLYYLWAVVVMLLVYLLLGEFAAMIGLIYLLVAINSARALHYHYRTVHIAISRNGIYVDECDDSNQTLMLRTIIKYENINEIFIASFSYVTNYRMYEAYIKNAEGTITNVFYGFFPVQKFVDIVKAMVESHRLSLDDTTTVDNDNTIGNNNPTSTTNNQNSERIHLISKYGEDQQVSFDEPC